MIVQKLSFSVACAALFVSSMMAAQEISGFSHPESVFVSKEHVFVSNVGAELAPLAKDNDGFISRLNEDGVVLEYQFLTNLNAPKGMNQVGDILYVVDIDTLKGFNLKDKKQIFNLPIENSVFLNDIVVLDSDTLLVSDTGTGIIHKVYLKNKKYETFIKVDAKYGGPNGLLIDKTHNALIVVGYDPNGKNKGSVISVDIQSKSVTALTQPLGALDGVTFTKNGDLLVSDWGENFEGLIYQIDSTGKAIPLKLQPIRGPADMMSDGKNLWIPKMAEGKVLKIDLP